MRMGENGRPVGENEQLQGTVGENGLLQADSV